jgi:hypothetical protein
VRRHVTVRELGGSIWAEVTERIWAPDASLEGINSDQLSRIIDLLMGVLARYEGAVITNDQDIPVVPLPHSEPPGAAREP